MKRPIKVFEPIPKQLIKSIHFQGKQHGFSAEYVYHMIKELIGIPSMTALSRQEALFLIGAITRQGVRAIPLPPPFENEVAGGADLASFYHVRDIRLMFADLGWDKAQIKGWLKKLAKVEDVRSLNRKQAQKVYFALGKIVDRARAAEKPSTGGW
nr:hypothetical protein [uncultured Desulfobulbus sp.]